MYIWDLFGHNYTGALRFPDECAWEWGEGLSRINRVTDQEGFPKGLDPDYGKTCERMAQQSCTKQFFTVVLIIDCNHFKTVKI